MELEREILTREYFPELRVRCENHGLTFVPIDLRWGQFVFLSPRFWEVFTGLFPRVCRYYRARRNRCASHLLVPLRDRPIRSFRFVELVRSSVLAVST